MGEGTKLKMHKGDDGGMRGEARIKNNELSYTGPKINIKSNTIFSYC